MIHEEKYVGVAPFWDLKHELGTKHYESKIFQYLGLFQSSFQLTIFFRNLFLCRTSIPVIIYFTSWSSTRSGWARERRILGAESSQLAPDRLYISTSFFQFAYSVKNIVSMKRKSRNSSCLCSQIVDIYG